MPRPSGALVGRTIFEVARLLSYQDYPVDVVWHYHEGVDLGGWKVFRDGGPAVACYLALLIQLNASIPYFTKGVEPLVGANRHEVRRCPGVIVAWETN